MSPLNVRTKQKDPSFSYEAWLPSLQLVLKLLRWERRRTCSTSPRSSAAAVQALRVRNLGGGDVDTATPMGSMLITIMAALGQMGHEIKRERVVDSIAKRRAADEDLGA